MTTPLVMTFIGRDRPGLVNAISRKVAEHGGAWLESRLARLGGEFAGIARVNVPDDQIAGLGAALRELEGTGLTVTVEVSVATGEPEPRATLKLDLLGLDRPGIVRDVTDALTLLGVNIEEFESGLESAPFTGAPMFRASARLAAPDGLSVDELRKTLERLAGEMMVDIAVSEGEESADASR
jgi:glycine cleavage system regulatory protein